METTISVLIGLITGFFASYIFWGYQKWQKPRIEIASEVSLLRDEISGEEICRFKILNKGKNQVINITFKAWLCKLIEVPGGKVSSVIHKFDIGNSNTLTLAGRGKSERPWGLTEETTFQCHSLANVLDELNHKENRIMVTLKASDALTGSTIVIQHVFSRRDIRRGSFHLGESMSISN